ncbi:MAG: tetratricopeptide repeat protein [Leptospiraceae bacterium]|nr:tetratricopeptide repeat protein [Leptospiraceae bacterium]
MMRALLLSLLPLCPILTTGIWALTSKEEKAAAVKLHQAFNAYFNDKPEVAARAFEEYLKLKGENEVALRYLARIALGNGDTQSAALYLERAIKADPEGLYSLQLLSEVYIKQSKYNDAVRVLEQLLQKDPLNERALHTLAYVYQQQNDGRNAATQYKRLIVAVQKGTNNPELLAQALYFLGNYYYQQDNYQRSLYYFRKLHELDSDNVRYLMIVGELEKITGQFRKSAATHERLLSLQPDFVQAWESLAETRFILNDPGALTAVQHYRKLRKSGKPGILAGVEQQLQGKDDEALKAYDAVLQSNQNRLSARLGRYRIYQKRGMQTEARNEAFAVAVIAQRLGANDMAREFAHITLDYLNTQAAQIQFREKFYSPATPPDATLTPELEQLAQDFAELYTTHAATLEANNEHSAAVTWYELAAQTIARLREWYAVIAKNPATEPQQKAHLKQKLINTGHQLYQIRVSQAWAQASAKSRFDEAEKNADKAIALAPEQPPAWFVKGMIAHQNGEKNPAEHKRAAEFFTKAISLSEQRNPEKPAPASYYFYCGVATEKTQDFPTAEKYLKRAIDLDPYNSVYLNYLSYMYSLRNIKLEEANALVLRALEDDPENEAYLDTFGWILFKQGNYRDALEQLNVAFSYAQKKNRIDPVIYFHLAEVHFRLNNRSSALDFYLKTRNDIKHASEPLDMDYINRQIQLLEAENKPPKPSNGEKR